MHSISQFLFNSEELGGTKPGEIAQERKAKQFDKENKQECNGTIYQRATRADISDLVCVASKLLRKSILIYLYSAGKELSELGGKSSRNLQ